MAEDGATPGPPSRVRSWRESHGREGGEVNVDDEVMRAWTSNVGATIMGRNMFGVQPGSWDEAEPWRGWWGDEPPFRHPVFVLTHHRRAPLKSDKRHLVHLRDGGHRGAARLFDGACDERLS